LELGGGSLVQVDFEPSIELAHGYRKADISARARPPGRETPGFRIPSPLASTKRRAIQGGRAHGASRRDEHWARWVQLHFASVRTDESQVAFELESAAWPG
jgi:hypothetical protein